MTLNNLLPGLHTILYKSISGWTAPSNEAIVLTNGVATTLSRTYLQNGSLTVNLEPHGRGVGRRAMARGPAASGRTAGCTVSNLSPISHEVEFSPVDGWSVEPAITNVTISEAANRTITMTYLESEGTLQVFLLPTNAVLAGAQWRVNGGAWREQRHERRSILGFGHEWSTRADCPPGSRRPTRRST